MKYVPAAVGSDDQDIAEAPYFGGEFAVFVTRQPAVMIGQIDLSAAATGAYSDNLANSIKSGGADLQLVALTPILSSVAAVLKLATLDDSGTPTAMDITATFTPPTRAANQSFDFPRGIAVDFVPASSGKKVTSITGLANSSPITGGGANQSFGVYQLPEQSDYSLILATKDIDFNTRSRVAKGIDAGMESDRWIKRGKTQPGELSIGHKLQSLVEGFMRFDGIKTTIMLVGLKDGQLTGDRIVFTECVMNVKGRLPEGDGEADANVTGKFREVLMFFAP